VKSEFSKITESPGIGATREQLAMLSTRYSFAARCAGEGAILEVACGTGIGLGLLAERSGAVTGCDIDADNVRIARATWNGDSRIRVEGGDAGNLEYPDASFGTVVCFEALYYFPDLEGSLREMARVLQPNGTIVICTVNPQWSGFNRSPYTVDYPTPATLSPMLTALGFRVEAFGAFADNPRGFGGRLISGIRRVAVRCHLIPGSMRGKELLKKLFLGGTVPMPARLEPSMAPVAPMHELLVTTTVAPWKVFYLTAVKAH
jgi:SAM-dependent methyltransferase